MRRTPSDLLSLGNPAWVVNSGFNHPIPIRICTNRYTDPFCRIRKSHTQSQMWNHAGTFTCFPNVIVFAHRIAHTVYMESRLKLRLKIGCFQLKHFIWE